MKDWKHFLLCSPELVPQILGGDGPSGLLTLNPSVRHCPNWVTPMLALALTVTSPPLARLLVTVLVAVVGPVMTKESKSSLNC